VLDEWTAQIASCSPFDSSEHRPCLRWRHTRATRRRLRTGVRHPDGTATRRDAREADGPGALGVR
jgi:hypothetical protein